MAVSVVVAAVAVVAVSVVVYAAVAVVAVSVVVAGSSSSNTSGCLLAFWLQLVLYQKHQEQQ